ncbi:MAG: Imm53 family immunity protein [Planctomycetota bacterium]
MLDAPRLGKAFVDLCEWWDAQTQEHGRDIVSLIDQGGYWSLYIDVTGTTLEAAEYEEVDFSDEANAEMEFHAWREENTWRATCTSSALPLAIESFVEWAKGRGDWPNLISQEALAAQEFKKNLEHWKNDTVDEPCKIDGCNANRVRSTGYCPDHLAELFHRDRKTAAD